MAGELVKGLSEEQRRYCINQCECGKKKVQELLQSCESIFDAVDDMDIFTQSCFNSASCPLKQSRG